MFTDSHCHLTFPELAAHWPQVRAQMAAAQVTRALCICTTMEEFAQVHALAMSDPAIWASVGVHPDTEGLSEPSADELCARAALPRVVAIGETGLDYYQMAERKGGRSIADMEWQRTRFRTHIRAARACGLPLIVHTRAAADDTLRLLREEGEGQGGAQAGGVFHCFTETREVALAALDMGYFVSFSGIVTFKSARDLQEVAKLVPDDRLLIETDAPYLAPVPHRGKANSPAYVPHVAAQLAQLRGCAVSHIAQLSRDNFDRLFPRVVAAA